MKRAFSAILGVLLLAPAMTVMADTPVPEETSVSADAGSTQEIIVKLTDGSAHSIEQVENVPGVDITDVLGQNTVLATVQASSAESAADLVEDLPSVSYAEPNYARGAFTLTTNDTYKDRMWALDNFGQAVNGTAGTAGDDTHAALAWNTSFGTSTVVAVIDSGVLYTHPDLASSTWDGSSCVSDTGAALGGCIHGYDFTDNDKDPMPVSTSTSFAHGTHVAGIIAAGWNNGTGTIGIAPSAKVMALRFSFDVASEVRAIDFARLNGAKIINASYGGVSYSQAEYDAIKRFTDGGGIFIAAAGNGSVNDDTAPTYPASYNLQGIVSVAATDQNDALASFSSYGATSVDLGAPGVNILSTYITGTSTPAYAYADGTSMAAPYVAGTAALAESAYPSVSTSTLISALLWGDAAPSLATSTVSGKRLNALKVLQVAGGADITPPVISLTGATSISLAVGDTYTELGATALDTHDGTTTVMIGGDAVNTSIAGVYHVTYDAVDIASNHAVQAVRTVTVSAPVVASSGGGGGGGGGGSHSSSSSSKKSSKSSTASKPVSNPPRPALSSSGQSTAQPSVSATVPPVFSSLPPSFLFVRTLAAGSTGTDVTALQQLLTRAGVYTGPVTGYFGPLTAAAVRAYQAKHALEQVGIIGPMTRALLNQGTL